MWYSQVIYQHLYPRDPDLWARPMSEDGGVALSAPLERVELFTKGEFMTDYAFDLSLTMPAHWYASYWSVEMTAEIVGDMAPDRCIVALRGKHMWKVFIPNAR